jgi:hypothetical protein
MDQVAEWFRELWPALIAAGAAQALVLILVSAGLVFAVLVLLGSVYRSAETKLDKPVLLSSDSHEGWAWFAPQHFRNSRAQEGKYPRLELYLPDQRRKPIFSKAVKVIIVRSRSKFVHDGGFEGAVAEGGRIAIDEEARREIEAILKDRFGDAGPAWNQQQFFVRLRYPSRFNISYLLKEHPDMSVRVSAWVFILTSLFAVVQAIIMRALHY